MARLNQLVLSSSEISALIELIDKRVVDLRFAKKFPNKDMWDDHRLTKNDFQMLANRLRKMSDTATTRWSEFIVLPVAQTRKEHNNEITRCERDAKQSAKRALLLSF